MANYPKLTLLIFCLNSVSSVLVQCYEFDQEYFGTSFSPYVKEFGNVDDRQQFGEYTYEEVKVMLKVLSTRFNRIATYSSGSHLGNLNSSWEDGQGNAFIARAAAEINREAGKKLLTMAQGVYQIDDPVHQAKEIEYGILEAEHANQIYPGTVWGLIIYNLYVNNEDEGRRTLDTIRAFKDKAHNLQISIGTRIGTCDQINGGDLREFIADFARESDFLMCNIHPKDEKGTKSPDQVVEEVGQKFWKFATPLKEVNPNLEVLIGDTGWPSAGVSFSGTHNTLKNMRDYWYRLNEWAAENKIRVHTFEAYDEPWKSNPRTTDPKDPGGAFGGENHFGWWRISDNLKIAEDTIVEKITEIGTPIWVWILVAIILVLLTCGVIFTIYYLQYKNVYLDQLAEAEIEEFERGIPEAAKDGAANGDIAWNYPYNREYELAKDNVTIDQSKLLGSGEFGIVYKGKAMSSNYHTPIEAAIKTTKPRSSAVTLKSLLSEIKTMIYIGKHENIVEFIGACTGELRSGIVYVIMEFCPGGSLENHLRSLRTSLDHEDGKVKPEHYENLKPLPSGANENEYINQIPNILPKLKKWAHEIANGMEFLANKNVIHADLATRNVLLTANETAKITDFGLSRRLYEYTEYVKKNQEPLPWRWMSPESLHSMTFSSQSDVWSYGITLWEIFSLGDIPYPGLSWTLNFVDKLFAGMKPNCPKYAPVDVYKTMELCWETRPESRPNFSVLKEMFDLKPEETSL